jgi:hypothetical protein
MMTSQASAPFQATSGNRILEVMECRGSAATFKAMLHATVASDRGGSGKWRNVKVLQPVLVNVE